MNANTNAHIADVHRDNIVSTEPDLTDLFESNSSEWQIPSAEICKREGVWSNELAYSERQATFCLIVKRSNRGIDYALGEAGLRYLFKAQQRGSRYDGKPVRHTLVVQADPDPNSKNQLHPLRTVYQMTVQQMRDYIQRNGIQLNSGVWGLFYWVGLPEVKTAQKDEWSQDEF